MKSKITKIIILFLGLNLFSINSYANDPYINVFYAINSFDQFNYCKLDNSLENFDSICFGWSRIQYDDQKKKLELNITTKNNNDFYIPNGYYEPLTTLKNNKINSFLNVYANKYYNYIFQNNSNIINQITVLITKLNIDGIVLNFENLPKEYKNDFVNFIQLLKNELKSKNLYVTVPPQSINNFVYDYKKIGQISDKVIFMAHDYDAKYIEHSKYETKFVNTPLTPIDKVEQSLKIITDNKIGIEDKSKILFQFSFSTIQWKIKDTNLVSSHQNDEQRMYPFRPTYDQIYNRIKLEQAKGKSIDEICKYDETLCSPYITYYNSEDNTQNIAWYEDARSIKAKLDLVKKYGIGGISIWRFGTIPQFKSNTGINSYLNVLDILK